MTLTVKINCDGDAFDGPGLGIECARLLRQLADTLNWDPDQPETAGGRLYDANGNDCGEWRFTL